MTMREAEEIATLLNERNDLTREYDANEVKKKCDQYLFESVDGAVVACVQLKKVQWYQWEICHLSVAAISEGKGLGKRLVEAAERRATELGGIVLQCTIKPENIRSERVFSGRGFRKVSCFFNPNSEHTLNIWQKVLPACPDRP
jgi:N-acetylglutamate synthase-like GNAT family acetyltransferase